MRRLLLLLAFEVRLVRTAIPLHAVAIIQPSVLLLLMGWVFLTPTFEMWVVQPDDAPGEAVVEAMSRVRSPELPYIAPVLVEAGADVGPRQLIEVGLVDGRATAVQTFPLIDSNIVKNLRNRLTAALVVLWDDALGGRAVGVRERPWLPKDLPFVLFFGLAALPMGAFISPAMTGAFLTARDFEEGTFVSYRLSPIGPGPVLGARLLRLTLTGLLSAGVMLTVLGLLTGAWPSGAGWGRLLATLVPMALIGGCFGVSAGLLLRRSIPAFLMALVATFGGWILGCAFGLRGSFGRGYEVVSAAVPNSWAVELLFPVWFDRQVGDPRVAATVLTAMVAILLVGVWLLWLRRMRGSS